MTNTIQWLGWLLLAVSAHAQTEPSYTVVPKECATREGNGGTLGFFADYAARHQLVVDAKHLQGRDGQEIRAIAFRQDGTGRPAVGGRLWLDVSLSCSPRASDNASTRFADNRGLDLVQVFTGYVVLPSGKPTSAPAAWTPSLALIRPFLYRGGSLCMDIVTRLSIGNDLPQPPGWFALDADVRMPAGEIVRYGTSCQPAMVASAPSTRFVVGATGSFNLSGRASVGPGTALLFVGSRPASVPLDPVAPGCTLLVELLWMFPLAVDVTGELAGSRFELPLPVQRSLQGTTLHAQWAHFVPAANHLNLLFSDGLRASIGAPSQLGCAWLENRDAAAPESRIDTDAIPVMRLEMAAR